jgi:hypothetical protein
VIISVLESTQYNIKYISYFLFHFKYLSKPLVVNMTWMNEIVKRNEDRRVKKIVLLKLSLFEYSICRMIFDKKKYVFKPKLSSALLYVECCCEVQVFSTSSCCRHHHHHHSWKRLWIFLFSVYGNKEIVSLVGSALSDVWSLWARRKIFKWDLIWIRKISLKLAETWIIFFSICTFFEWVLRFLWVYISHSFRCSQKMNLIFFSCSVLSFQHSTTSRKVIFFSSLNSSYLRFVIPMFKLRVIIFLFSSPFLSLCFLNKCLQSLIILLLVQNLTRNFHVIFKTQVPHSQYLRWDKLGYIYLKKCHISFEVL